MENQNEGFTIICNNCGTKRVLKEGYDSYEEGKSYNPIYVSSYMAGSIGCRACGAEVEGD